MPRPIARIQDGLEEVAIGAGRLACRLAVSGIIGAAAIAPLPIPAHGQTAAPKSGTAAPNVVVPQEICHMAAQTLNGYVRANIDRITDPADRAQLGILAQWIKAGCQGTVRLQRTDQAIAAATHIQGVIGSRFNFNNVITLGP